MNNFLNKHIFKFFVAIAIVLYALTIRGNLGIPTEQDVTFDQIASGQAFETSQERSRYAMILSMYHYGAFNVDPFPQMGTPDIGFINGHYYSFFPPTVSALALPFYILGLKVGATQLLVFLISTIFAFATGVLLYKYGRKLGISDTKAAFIAFAFLFATNAWGYSVTLYAHLVSAFIILCGAYVLQFFSDTFKKGVLIWALYAAALFVDFPNIFLYFPIALIYSLQGLKIRSENSDVKFRFSFLRIVTPVVFAIAIIIYGYYNYTQFGSPTILSNNLPRVRNLQKIEEAAPEIGRSVTGALYTRRLVEGYYTFIFSKDRGILIFSPILLLSVLGIARLKKAKKPKIYVLAAIPILCLTLYSTFHDPWGGWAFGSRYLIVSYPYLLLLAGLFLAQSERRLTKLLFSVLFIYSAAISLLAPLTTNVIPPYIEARTLGLESTYVINWGMIKAGTLNSFFFNNVVHGAISAQVYYFLLLTITVLAGLTFIWLREEK